MITAIEIVKTEQYPYYEVALNGQPLQAITNDSNSPTGRSGCVRRTFIGDDYVVKIGSIGEASLEIEEKDKSYFAEVVLVSIDREWLIQKRVNCIPNQSVSSMDWEDVLSLIQKYNVGDVCYQVDEYGFGPTPHNWTVDVSGQPIVFDYDYNGNNGNGFMSWQFRSRTSNPSDCSCSDCKPYSDGIGS